MEIYVKHNMKKMEKEIKLEQLENFAEKEKKFICGNMRLHSIFHALPINKKEDLLKLKKHVIERFRAFSYFTSNIHITGNCQRMEKS